MTKNAKSVPDLPKGEEIHVYRFEVNRQYLQLLELLSKDEIERLYSLRRELDKAQFVTGRALLRQQLGRYLNTDPRRLNFSYNANGKPSLSGNELIFNISHSGQQLLLGIAHKGLLGVDIEQIAEIPNIDEISEIIFSPSEKEQLKAISPTQRMKALYRGWTLKEAVLKSLGLGIGEVLQAFAVDLIGSSHQIEAHGVTPEMQGLSVFDISVGEQYQCAIATSFTDPVIVQPD